MQQTVDEIPTVWVARADLLDILLFLRKLPKPYVMLFDLSAIDERLRQHRAGLPDSDFTVFYHLMSLERNSDVRIKVALSEDDVNVPSATNIWPNANWYEREVWDMFGIVFTGHPRFDSYFITKILGRSSTAETSIMRVQPNLPRTF